MTAQENPQARLQDIIANRPKDGASPKGLAAATNIVNFQDWLFFGTAPNVFAQVGIVPTSQDISVSYAVIVIETPNGNVFSNASVGTSNAMGGWALNLATDTSLYDIGSMGNQVQVWAFAQAYVSGQIQSQYSETQNYTVNS